MFCSRQTSNMINKIHERALRMVLNNHISDFEVMLLNIDDITIHYRNIQTLISERKTTAFYGLETITYRAPQLWAILPEEFKQRNKISIIKSNVRHWICNECPCRLCKLFVPNLGFIWDTAPNLYLIFIMDYFNACIYIYMYLALQGDTCPIGNIPYL